MSFWWWFEHITWFVFMAFTCWSQTRYARRIRELERLLAPPPAEGPYRENFADPRFAEIEAAMVRGIAEEAEILAKAREQRRALVAEKQRKEQANAEVKDMWRGEI